MKCQYCQRKCRKVAPQKFDNQRAYWQCDWHGGTIVKFLSEFDGGETGWTTTILVCKYKDFTFHACFFYNNPNIREKFRIDKLPNKPMSSTEAIFSLDFYPDVAPENIQKKFPTYILFS